MIALIDSSEEKVKSFEGIFLSSLFVGLVFMLKLGDKGMKKLFLFLIFVFIVFEEAKYLGYKYEKRIFL